MQPEEQHNSDQNNLNYFQQENSQPVVPPVSPVNEFPQQQPQPQQFQTYVPNNLPPTPPTKKKSNVKLIVIITIILLLLGVGVFVLLGFLNKDGSKVNVASNNSNETTLDSTKSSSAENFTWNGNTLTGLTDSGKKQAKLVIPDSTKKIGDSVFLGDTSLTSITFGNGLEEIGDAAFWNCNLKEVSFPSSLKKIGPSAFHGCQSLKKVTFSVGLEEIGNDAFGLCSGLEKIELPEGLINIGYNSFSPCAYVHDLYLPASLENISKGTFLIQSDANVYVKKGSWADSHFAAFVGTKPANNALIYIKNYY